MLNSGIASFLDEKDNPGSFVLSHIYLLVGLSFPLWVNTITHHENCRLLLRDEGFNDNSILLGSSSSDIVGSAGGASNSVNTLVHVPGAIDGVCTCDGAVIISNMVLLSGVLSVGIGDTMASIGGIRFGKVKWPGSKKTIEGSVCGVIAQVFVVLLLWLCGWVRSYGFYWWIGVLISMVVCGAVEAFTDQVDNIVLPLIMFCGVSITEMGINS